MLDLPDIFVLWIHINTKGASPSSADKREFATSCMVLGGGLVKVQLLKLGTALEQELETAAEQKAVPRACWLCR